MVTAITTFSMVALGFSMTSATAMFGLCEYVNYKQKKERKLKEK